MGRSGIYCATIVFFIWFMLAGEKGVPGKKACAHANKVPPLSTTELFR